MVVEGIRANEIHARFGWAKFAIQVRMTMGMELPKPGPGPSGRAQPAALS